MRLILLLRLLIHIISHSDIANDRHTDRTMSNRTGCSSRVIESHTQLPSSCSDTISSHTVHTTGYAKSAMSLIVHLAHYKMRAALPTAFPFSIECIVFGRHCRILDPQRCSEGPLLDIHHRDRHPIIIPKWLRECSLISSAAELKGAWGNRYFDFCQTGLSSSCEQLNG
jgi:hypothetical protein